MVAVCGLVFGGLKVPPGTEGIGKKVKVKQEGKANGKVA